MQGGVFGVICALVISVYAYTAHSAYVASTSLNPADDYYNLLVRGFRAGQLNLIKEVPLGLARLADPYDPAAHSSYPVLDLSYYKGKFYLYFGVTPAVALLWPYVALTGHYLSQKNAAVVFCVVGFLASVGLLHALWKRYFTEVNTAVVALGALAIGFATFTPFLLARIDVYEVPISCGYALTMLALAAIWKALHEPEPRRRRGWLVAASLSYGLAVGARPSLLFGAVILLVPVIQAWRERETVLGPLLAAIVPITLIGLGLMLYNTLRFDTPFEFGWRYKLEGGVGQLTSQLFSLRYLWFNFRVYFLELARWSGRFPFAHDIRVPPVPAGHAWVEHPFGVLTNIPLVWLALAMPLAWRGRSAEARSTLREFLLAVAVLFAICTLILCLFFGACVRYEVDFLPALVLLAVIGIFSLERALAGWPVCRRAAHWGWSLLLGFSVAFNLSARADPIAEAHNNLGVALMSQGRLQEAIEQYEQALRLRPNYVLAQNNLGIALQQAGRVQEASQHYEQALRNKSDYAKAHNNMGIALAQAGRTQDAIVYYEQALQAVPDFAEAHYNLGNALVQLGRVQEAIGHYQQAVQIQPDHARAHYNLGNALMGQGRLQEAIDHYEQALRIKPDYASAHNNLGNALEGVGRVGEAKQHYELALQIDSQSAEAHSSLGNILLREGKVGEAIGHYEQAVRAKPENAVAHDNLGIALMRQGRLVEAIGQYEQELRLKPDLAEAHYNLGVALAQARRDQEAIGHFEQAVLLQPDYAAAHNKLAAALMGEGRLGEAISHYEQVVRLQPDDSAAHDNLGVALVRSGRGQEAIEQWEQALRISPDSAEAHYNLGLTLEKLGRSQEAIQHYGQALRIKPDLVEAQNALARARAAQ
jgi:tetratricopeptide (TPR) repeat protein